MHDSTGFLLEGLGLTSLGLWGLYKACMPAFFIKNLAQCGWGLGAGVCIGLGALAFKRYVDQRRYEKRPWEPYATFRARVQMFLNSAQAKRYPSQTFSKKRSSRGVQ